MCGAFSTKRRRTGGSKTPVASENGAVGKNGVVNKYYGVLCKNDALERNDVRHNAATPRQPTRRRAKPDGPSTASFGSEPPRSPGRDSGHRSPPRTRIRDVPAHR